MTRALALSLAACILSAGAGPAAADERPERIKLRVAERQGALIVKDLFVGSLLFDRDAYAKLDKNPLATVIVMRLYVYRKGADEPLAYSLLNARMVYDLWLEQYEVRVEGPAGIRSSRHDYLSEAYKAVTEHADVPVAALDDIAIGPHHYLALVLELNPVSEATLAEMRRWLTRPAGTASLDRGTSFFGSFVSIFVNAKLPAADRVVRARSQPFYRVAR